MEVDVDRVNEIYKLLKEQSRARSEFKEKYPVEYTVALGRDLNDLSNGFRKRGLCHEA